MMMYRPSPASPVPRAAGVAPGAGGVFAAGPVADGGGGTVAGASCTSIATGFNSSPNGFACERGAKGSVPGAGGRGAVPGAVGPGGVVPGAVDPGAGAG